MEIVPILSTIILVGTVATFILAVAAYILYKMREGGGDVLEENQVGQIEPHHVVMPVDYSAMMGQMGDSGPSEASTYFAPTATTPPHGAFIETSNGYGVGSQNANGYTRGAQPLPSESRQAMSLDAFFWDYTDEGFSPIELKAEDEFSNRKTAEKNPEEELD